MRAILLILFCFSAFLLAQAQDLKKDLELANSTLKGAKTFEMVSKYSIYPDHASDKASEVVQSSFIKKENKFYLKMAGVTTIQTDNLQLVADNDEKTIILYEPDANFLPSMTDFDFEKASKFYEKVTHEIQGTEKVYSIKFKYPKQVGYEKISISFNLKEHYITKMVFYMVDVNDPEMDEEVYKPRVEIILNLGNFNAEVTDKQFSVTDYIIEKNGQISLAKPFNNYRLVNTIKM